MKAAAHPQQQERLEALHRYAILDTDREQDYDDFVSLASKICETPISVVNLIDAERQWFKAEVGLGVRETPLDTSICSHVILENEYVEIHDTLQDDRMQDNPLCNGESGLRFYAGAQLKTQGGLPLGTLCVLDYKPRKLTELQRETLRVLAKQIMNHLELRLALENQKMLRKEVDHRVKNSLQLVSSLIRMQERASENPDTKAALHATEQRIDAIAQLHQALYRADASNELALQRFMGEIAQVLRRSCPETIELAVEFDDLKIDPAKASAIAIMVNEFVANSMKHAFPGIQQGKIKVTGRRASASNYEIELQDDGIGVGENSFCSRPGLGTRIMQASAMRLGGHFETRSTDIGTNSIVRFSP